MSFLRGVPGADLLKLTREDVIQICGPADGIRLFNALKGRWVDSPGNPLTCTIVVHPHVLILWMLLAGWSVPGWPSTSARSLSRHESSRWSMKTGMLPSTPSLVSRSSSVHVWLSSVCSFLVRHDLNGQFWRHGKLLVFPVERKKIKWRSTQQLVFQVVRTSIKPQRSRLTYRS